MKTKKQISRLILTNKAHCRDCYRCVRHCPVKAIRMEDGQAYVDEERCILCGNCVRQCPQNAKTYRNDVHRVLRFIDEGDTVIASVAPSHPAVYPDWKTRRLPSALRMLGFTAVTETALGAALTAREEAAAARAGKTPFICTACPAAVSYVEKYDHGKVHALSTTVSPMIAHGRYLKEKHGPQARVVFIGPCIAKKGEIERHDLTGSVDAVLTFDELNNWLAESSIELRRCEESGLDEEAPASALLYPLSGGMLRSADLGTDLLSEEILTVTGMEDIADAVSMIGATENLVAVEPLFCRGGCINGPGLTDDNNVFERRERILKYAKLNQERENGIPPADYLNLKTSYHAEPVKPAVEITEEKIREVLALTGKTAPEDLYDCGACGYESCRAKAVAVLEGLAEPDMCIPFMRRAAEQRTDKVIAASPNGIVMLDEQLKILHVNSSFMHMFRCSAAVTGRHLSYLMDTEPFEKIASGETDLIEQTVTFTQYGLTCHLKLFPLPEDKQYVGIFIDITESDDIRKKLNDLRSKTILQAQELLDHQVRQAQELAKFLGESTAQGEALVENMLKLSEDEEQLRKRNRNWLNDIYTTK